MAKILVIDDEAIVRELIAASLKAHGYEVACAGDGRAAQASIHAERPALILLDVRMPGQDGISLLRVLRSTAGTMDIPVLLLSASTDREVILEAAKLGVQGYILKPKFSLKELLSRISALLTPGGKAADPAERGSKAVGGECGCEQGAPTAAKVLQAGQAGEAAPGDSCPRLLTREQTLERLEKVAGGKTIAGVVTQLISVANSSEASLGDVVRVIQSDPILAARVLQLANSASAGSRGRIRSVEDAARNLGVQGIKNMAISIGIVGAFVLEDPDGFSSMRCWQHSYAVADLLNLIVRPSDAEQASANHLVGLCHDLGEILIRQHFAGELRAIMEYATEHRLPPHQVGSVALGVRQPELVSRLLGRIGLPIPVVQAIREFCERQIREQTRGISAGAHGLSLANLAAHGLLFAASTHDCVRPITRVEWRQLNGDTPPPTINATVKRNEILIATSLLARLSAQEEEQLLVPLVPRVTQRIWYVRPETFVAFDPLAFALSLCSDVVISDELPGEKDWQDMDALVLVGLRDGAPPIVTQDLAAMAGARGRPELPILALVAQESACRSEGSVVVRSYPIGLGELGQWLAGIPRFRSNGVLS